ncbi:MAG: DEAD/DEAH box helicase, partial [Betaproteobacteria bacterium]
MAVARVALPVAAASPFDYWIPDGLDVAAGDVVRVRLGGRSLAGVVASVEASSPFIDRLHPIESVVDVQRLPAEILDLVAFAGAYYQASPGMVFSLAIPPLRKGRAPRGADAQMVAPDGARARHQLNPSQAQAVDAIVASRGAFSPMLLFGVTGSGKTEVYLAAAESMLAADRQVLILVPEINLTPQFEARVQATFPGIPTSTLHSGLASGARRRSWDAAANGASGIVLATRLGVFTPLPRLGLIVVDEEHDASYKQQDGVRYH